VKITLTTSGGQAAAVTSRLPPRSVDVERLPAQTAQQLARLVAAARAAGTPQEEEPGRARDAMSYRILVEDEDQSIVLTASDAAMSREFASLLDWLERHSEPAR
jgi:hypothetical protein